MGGEQLLGEERVAGAAREDLVRQRRQRRLSEHLTQQRGQVVSAKGRELDALHRNRPVQFGQPLKHRITRRQLIGTDAQHDQHRKVAGSPQH
jgi:hypothetical protein